MSKRLSLTNTPRSKYKRPKLDLLMTQSNSSPQNKQISNDDDWGEDYDDEILFLASQACEKVETSVLKSNDSTNYVNRNDTTMKQLEIRSNSITQNTSINFSVNNYIVNNSSKEVYEKFSSDVINMGHQPNKNNATIENTNQSITNIASKEEIQKLLKELHNLKTENVKLRAEREESLDKCTTKVGEVNILRSQLKSVQSQMTMVKMEKLKHQERLQMEWSEKFKQANNEIENFKTQLEFKNHEMNNIKEKCKLLESSRIKFVEPSNSTPDNHKWTGIPQRMNSSIIRPDTSPRTFVTTKEMASQIDTKLKHIKLIPHSIISYPLKYVINESIYHHSVPEGPIMFSSIKKSEFVEHSNFSYIRKRMINDFCGGDVKKDRISQEVIKLECIYKDLTVLMNLSQKEIVYDKYSDNIIRIVFISNQLLMKLHRQLELLSMKVTLLTLSEMDKKYLEYSKSDQSVLTNCDLFDGRCWFENEQAIDARRALAVVSTLCDNFEPLLEILIKPSKWIRNTLPEMVNFLQTIRSCCKCRIENKPQNINIFDLILEICQFIGKIGCSHLYTGLLSSICNFIKTCIKKYDDTNNITSTIYIIIREILLFRPHSKIVEYLTDIMNLMKCNKDFLDMMCCNLATGEVLYDYYQGVIAYSKKTCSMQLLCNNIEVWSTCYTEIEHMEGIFKITQNLMEMSQYARNNDVLWGKCNMNICKCGNKLNVCICVCLHRCVYLYSTHISCLRDKNMYRKFNSTIRAGILFLQFYALNEIDYVGQLERNEHFQMFVTTCNKFVDKLQLQKIHKDALLDLMPFFWSSEPFMSEALEYWEQSFQTFHITN